MEACFPEETPVRPEDAPYSFNVKVVGLALAFCAATVSPTAAQAARNERRLLEWWII
jgi:hypothetical protein